jgi:hypothetical protein
VIQRIIAVDPAVEFCQRFGILRCRAAHDQAIAQVTQYSLLFGEHNLSCRANAWNRARWCPRRTIAVIKVFELLQGGLGILEMDALHADLFTAFDIDVKVVDEDRLVRTHPGLLQGNLKIFASGFATPTSAEMMMWSKASSIFSRTI